MLKDRLRNRIEAAGTSAAAVGNSLNARSKVYDILSGKSGNPGVQTLKLIAEKLGTTVAYLIGETDDPSPALRPHALEDAPLVVADEIAVGSTPRGMVFLGLDAGEAGKAEYLLSLEQGIVLHHRMGRVLDRIQEQQLHPSSISS